MYENFFKFGKDEERLFDIKEFNDRLIFLKQKGVDTIVLTGSDSEPLFNETYLEFFAQANEALFGNDRFVNIEVQTSGVGLTDERIELAKSIGVKTFSLSLASFDDEKNLEIMRTPKKLHFSIPSICSIIKENGFNLRLSLNINHEGFFPFGFPRAEYFWHDNYYSLITTCQSLKADQITFRKLYSSGEDSDVNSWIRENKMESFNPDWWEFLHRYITKFGRPLNLLPFGVMKYSIEGMSVVVDVDCMNKKSDTEDLKYLILRRNCKLYSEWDDPASLIF
jgi:hypothetical protein